MIGQEKHSGFSLTEVLLAVGTLAIGMVFIGGTFLASIYFSTVSTERTIAAVAANEAFAKVRIFGGADPNQLLSRLGGECIDFNDIVAVSPSEFAYPSANVDTSQKQYYWSALCRRETIALGYPLPESRLIQVTVLVSRKSGTGMRYRNPEDPFNAAVGVSYPRPVPIAVRRIDNNVLEIDETGKEIFISDGSTIIENTTGHIYRVLNRPPDQPNTVVLDRPWGSYVSDPDPDLVWVIPPAFGSGRNPCVAVYQRVIRF